MEHEQMTSEMLQTVTTRLAEGFVREGLLRLPELSDEQLDKTLADPPRSDTRFAELLRQNNRASLVETP